MYAGKYGHQLKDFYARIQNAAKAVKRDTEIEIVKEQVHEVAYTAIVGLDKYVHEANHKVIPYHWMKCAVLFIKLHSINLQIY
ncbi:hypothetical protein AAAC51_45540 [Priestia megaterium]